MALYSLYFSPTGGTKKVMELLASTLGGARSGNLANPGEVKVAFTREDVVLLGVPSFGGRVPPLALQKIKQLKTEGARAVLVAVYGNREQEDTLLELRDAAVETGFRPVAGVTAVAEHSVLRSIAAGRPDGEDILALRDIGEKIKARLDSGEVPELLALPGNSPYKPLGPAGMPIEVTADCVGCGFCAGNCPAGAIFNEYPSRTDGEKCIGCMRCLTLCPVHGRRLPDQLLAGLEERLAPACAQRKEPELFL